jgi:hypothetical protein
MDIIADRVKVPGKRLEKNANLRVEGSVIVVYNLFINSPMAL